MARSVFAKRDGLVIWPIKEGKLVGLPQCTSLVSVRREGENVSHTDSGSEVTDIPLPKLKTFSGFLKLGLSLILFFFS